MKKTKFTIISIVLTFSLIAGCQPKDVSTTQAETKTPNQAPVNNGSIILATTTSTENSGLLEYILPDFEKKTGIKVKVVSVGTGKAIQMGIDGEADILLVHAKPDEEKFVADNHGIARYDVMYNDFIIIGPENDPAGATGNSVTDGLSKIKSSSSKFISRGDDSGTHKKELSLWDGSPSGQWYISVGKGMEDTITVANEMLAYTMTDRATYVAMKDNVDLKIIMEGDNILFNQYGVIPVNPDKNNKINANEAQAFLDWIISSETQDLIGSFKKHGEALFTPNAK